MRFRSRSLPAEGTYQGFSDKTKNLVNFHYWIVVTDTLSFLRKEFSRRDANFLCQSTYISGKKRIIHT
jgi:hypothetical protein